MSGGLSQSWPPLTNDDSCWTVKWDLTVVTHLGANPVKGLCQQRFLAAMDT